MYHKLYDDWRKAHPDEERPEYFVGANDLTPLEHVRVQAVAQEFIDSSISKTVNAPNAHTVDDVKTLYMAAYDYGLKGVTYMRDGSRQGVLERVDEKKKDASSGVAGSAQDVQSVQPALPMISVLPRPAKIEGSTYQLETPMGKTYVTINHTDDKQPFEVFITIGKTGSDVSAMADALGRMISLNLRLNGMLSPTERIRQVVAQLSGIGGARSVGFGPNRVRSFPDAIARALAQHFGFAVNGKVVDKKVEQEVLAQPPVSGNPNSIGANGTSNGHAGNGIEAMAETVSKQLPLAATTPMPHTNLFDICPECGTASFAYEEGCKKCYSCAYSEC